MQEQISFGAWLRKQRRALDLTRQEFADQVGCAEVTLRRIEAGTLKPSKELASHLLERVGIPENERSRWINFARGASGLPIQSSNEAIPNLPAQLTTFVGREKEQAEIIALITKYRLVTLTGPGGIGKTRLSIRVGKQIMRDHGDGVWLLELASVSDAGLLPQTAAALFGITAQPHIPFTDVVINYLRARFALLILDNCEHLLDACAQFADTLLKNCPRLRMLITSREPLGITGEAIYRVPPLAVPNFQQLRGTFRDYESVRLFEERAQLARTDFSLTMENASAVVQICRHLDGIPLAIELAAARVAMLSTQQIAVRLRRSLRLLRQTTNTGVSRHQTLQAVMDWSYDLLSSAEQLLLRRLAVFPGVWTLESAEAICADDRISSSAVMDLLSRLVAKSLVLRKRDGRYKFLEIIRQYALEKLLESGETQAIHQRHLAYFLAYAEQKGIETLGSNQIAALKHLKQEYESIRAAMDWAIETGQVEAATQIATGLAWLYWQSHALFQEAYERMMLILSHPMTSKEWLFRATALIIAAFHGSFILGDSKQIQAMIDEAIEISKLAGEKGQNQLAWAHAIWGLCVIGQDNRVAANALDIGLSMARAMNDKLLLANTLEFQGALASIQKDYSRAQALSNESILLFREMGNYWGIARALGNIGLVLYLRGNHDEARGYLEEALAIHREIADRNNLIMVLGILGKLSTLTAKFTQAMELFDEKLFFAISSGWTQEIGTCTRDLAYLNLYQGYPEIALVLFRESLSLLEIWDRVGISLNVAGIASGIFQLSLQNAEDAAILIGSVQSVLDTTTLDNLPYEKQQLMKTLGAVSAHLGDDKYRRLESRGKIMTLEAAVVSAQKAASR